MFYEDIENLIKVIFHLKLNFEFFIDRRKNNI